MINIPEMFDIIHGITGKVVSKHHSFKAPKKAALKIIDASHNGLQIQKKPGHNVVVMPHGVFNDRYTLVRNLSSNAYIDSINP